MLDSGAGKTGPTGPTLDTAVCARWPYPICLISHGVHERGWPGALLAQQFLRHKSTKAEFRSVFWTTVVLNVAGFAVLCSPVGRGVWALQ